MIKDIITGMNSADIASLVPNVDDLLELTTEEQGRLILTILTSDGGTNELMGPTRAGRVSQPSFFNRGNDYAAPPKYGSAQKKVDDALLVAWGWLVGQVLLCKDPAPGPDWFFVTDVGREMASREDTTAYRKVNLLPKGQLHPSIAKKVYPAFLRGEYDTAIFQAFREIEMAVREAGQFPPDMVGEKLMRAAFAIANNNQPPGPLTDNQLPIAEQLAMGNMFVGAFGVYRNSTGHRHVPTEPEEAAEVIMFASQLLRIVKRIKP